MGAIAKTLSCCRRRFQAVENSRSANVLNNPSAVVELPAPRGRRVTPGVMVVSIVGNLTADSVKAHQAIGTSRCSSVPGTTGSTLRSAVGCCVSSEMCDSMPALMV